MRAHQAWPLAAVIVAGLAGRSTGGEIPAAVKAALAKADSWDLYSLDPEQRKDPPKVAFHDWRVLGKTTVTDADTRQRLLAALEKGARENDGTVAGCFNPRHGIRVKSGDKTIDLVICFECYSAAIYAGDEKTGSFLTTRSPQPELNKVLTAAKVPLPKDR
jgi:hypothetical protein